MKVSCEHIATNCNPMANSIEFLNERILVLCFKNQVGIYSLETNSIMMNINYREIDMNRANCIKLFSSKDSSEQLRKTGFDCALVGYDSGHIILYQIVSSLAELEKDPKAQRTFKVLEVLKENSSIISLHLNGNVVLTNNNLGELTEYTINPKAIASKKQNQQIEDPVLKQTAKLKFPLNKIIQSIASFTYEEHIVIFVGGTDQKIHAYIRKLNGKQYSYCFSLSGHENGITKLVLTRQNTTKFDEYLLASASKDGYIRTWKITSNEEITKFHKNVKSLEFQTGEPNKKTLKVFLESVLISHECSVTNLSWVYFREKLQLASCSLDCTICIWGRQIENQDETGSWNVENRMGQLLGNKNAYFELITDPSNRFLVAVNYIGSALIWEYNKESDKFSLRQSFTGHSNEVKGLDWNHTGSFLVTVSKDQTTRVLTQHRETQRFAQISRAQVHGYDINAVAVIKVKDNTIDVIACGADQKVVRVVEPPACFANYLNSFTHRNLHLFFNSEQEEAKFIKCKANQDKKQPLLYETYSEGGAQVLGLMTKMERVERQKITTYYEEQEEETQEQEDREDAKTADEQMNFSRPPHDDYLVKHTLWPQMNKLYGHPHEIASLAHNQSGTLLASSCNALNKQSATILIWDTQKNWKILKMIQYHSYTVYGMEFSRNGKYFASVSKDRKLAVFNSEDQKFDLIFGYECHARAATCLSINFESTLIATGSRDKTIKLHDIAQQKSIQEINVGNQALFSVAFGQGEKVRNLIACGDQIGNIYILKISPLTVLHKVADSIGHTRVVNQIKWRGEEDEFATCSDDHSVKIFKVWLE